MADEWQTQTELANVQPDGEDFVNFNVVSRTKKGGNRLPERTRAYRDGSKSDHTGNMADTFDVQAIFHESVRDPEDPGGPMWPDRCDAFEAALKSRRVLTLNLPWERNIRCRAVDWERTAVPIDLRDGEMFHVTFRYDNEDALGQSVATVSVRAAIRQKVQEAVFDLEREGMSTPLIPATFDGPTLDETIDDIHRFAKDLDDALGAPEDAGSDVENKAKRLSAACKRVRETFTSRTPGRDKGNDPSGERSQRKLREAEELANHAAAGAVASRPRKERKRYDTQRDIYSIAAEENQNPERLIAINKQIEDLMAIPPRTIVFIEVDPL